LHTRASRYSLWAFILTLFASCTESRPPQSGSQAGETSCPPALAAALALTSVADTSAPSPIGSTDSVRLRVRREIVRQSPTIGDVSLVQDPPILYEARSGALTRLDGQGGSLWVLALEGGGSVLDLAVHGDTLAVLRAGGDGMAMVELYRLREPREPEWLTTALLENTVGETTIGRVLVIGRVGDSWAAVSGHDRTYALRPWRPDGSWGCPILQWADERPQETVDVGVSFPVTQPLSASPSFDFGGGGFLFALPERFTAVTFGEAGSMERKAGTGAFGAAITDSMRAAHFTELVAEHANVLARADTLLERRWLERAPAVFARLGTPEHLPVVSALFAAADGSIAIRRGDLARLTEAAGDSVAFDVFRADGTLRGRVALPAAFIVEQFTGDAWIGTEAEPDTSTTAPAAGERRTRQVVRYRIS
jgi:hypothetical protein